MLLLITANSYNMHTAACQNLSGDNKLVEFIVEKYKITADEAKLLLQFCPDLQRPEDFKNHVKRMDFERYFRDLLKQKK